MPAARLYDEKTFVADVDMHDEPAMSRVIGRLERFLLTSEIEFLAAFGTNDETLDTAMGKIVFVGRELLEYLAQYTKIHAKDKYEKLRVKAETLVQNGEGYFQGQL